MSDSNTPVEIVDVDVRAWVESARADPQLFRDRQVTEIVLAAIGLSASLHQSLILKGGALMALAFGSRRVTGDVDFSATVQPDGFDELLRAFRVRCALTGKAVRLLAADGAQSGTVAGIGDGGELLLQTPAGLRKLVQADEVRVVE